MSYKSPINMYQQLANSYEADVEKGIIKAVQRVGIDVDKEELLKALQYDRLQYEKGYWDGSLRCREISTVLSEGLMDIWRDMYVGMSTDEESFQNIKDKIYDLACKLENL